jgi:hypothetical protein
MFLPVNNQSKAAGKVNLIRMKRVVLLLLVFVFPYFIIYLSGLPHWMGRTIADAILILFLTGGIFWFSLSPKSEVIASGAKLNRSDLLKRKKAVERTLRILGVLFGIFFTAYLTVPFMADVGDVFRGKQPLRISGSVAANTSPVGLSYLKQSLYLHDDYGRRETDSYTFLYSFLVLKAGREYELTVLSRSMLVLDQKELGEKERPASSNEKLSHSRSSGTAGTDHNLHLRLIVYPEPVVLLPRRLQLSGRGDLAVVC